MVRLRPRHAPLPWRPDDDAVNTLRRPARPVCLRPAAGADILAAAGDYRADSGLGIALAFIDAVDRTLYEIARTPGSGSPAYAETLGIPGLRAVAIRSFPHRIFFREAASGIDVWRVLHGRREIPEALRHPAESRV